MTRGSEDEVERYDEEMGCGSVRVDFSRRVDV